MTSPINQPPTTTSVTQTGTTTTTTTVGGIGDHSVTTSATGQAGATAKAVETVASDQITHIAEQDPAAVSFSPERSFSILPPTTGQAGATAASSHTLGMQRLRPGTTSDEGDSASIIGSDDGAAGAAEAGEAPGADTDLGDLAGLRGSERAAGTLGAEGPGGLPDNAIPPYDPTSKASIISFLQNPAVQQRMQTKGGHYVYVDEARSSFIFVRNGDWSTAESIKITNAKTKEPVTKPADLEMCVAKFCVAHETMQADWSNNIQPTMEGRAGTTGTYDHLMLSMKFKTAVLYGPWNAKESSSGYTPSAWRRGAKVETGPIWDDVGGLQGINWKTTPKPDFNFAKETAGTGYGPGPGTGPMGGWPPYAAPVVNVNLGGITTTVSVGGTTTTVGGTTTTGTNQTGETGDDWETSSTTSTSSNETIEEETQTYEEEGNGVDNTSPPPSGPPPPPGPPPASSGNGVGFTGMSQATLKNVLTAISQHNSVVWNNNGEHVSGANQDLGTVVRTAEQGTNVPTIILPGGGAVNGTGQGGTGGDGGGAGGVGGSGGGTQGTGGNKGTGTDSGVDNRGLLEKIRKHLDDTYPNGDYVPNGVTLGGIIRGESGGGAGIGGTSSNIAGTSGGSTTGTTGTSGTGTSTGTTGTGGTSQAGQTSGSGGSGQGGRVKTSSTTTNIINQSGSGTADNRDLLKKIRKHLDDTYPNGEYVPNGVTLGGIIRGESGGGFVTASPQAGPARLAARVVQSGGTATSQPQPIAAGVVVGGPETTQASSRNLRLQAPAAFAETEGPDMRGPLHAAARDVTTALSAVANRMRIDTAPSSLTEDPTPSTTGTQLLAAAKQVATSLSATLDQIK